ncbi:non-ribosomal peptide synthetase [Peristeroidobacter agariperforans]|uniref:non-ribosomal peptide synthetase n=1 Tax=Peristeroidobacter agariperforans TaxID=268404 RepID=UPI00101C7658|nr:non-ribosomal peptide synthetase [Peristeroidobacter agariperforans]
MTQTSKISKERLGNLTADRAELVKLLLEAKVRRMEEIRPYPRDESFGRPRMPTSWAQQRLWFIDELEGGSTAYNMAFPLRLKGALDEGALQKALDEIVQRHEMLRTVFVAGPNGPTQEISPEGRFSLVKIDLAGAAKSSESAEAAVLAERQRELHQPFSLSSGPLIRGRLLRLGAQQHVLLITIHHIAADGWSLGVLVEELKQLYHAFHTGRAHELPVLSVQYGDYASWQREWLRPAVLEDQLSYWTQHLMGAPPQIELPTDRPRPAVQSYRGGNVPIALDAALTKKLRAFAKRHDMSLFMVLYAGWAVLLARLGGLDDVVIGTPVANRRRAELEPLIGFFVNTLVLRLGLDAELTIAELLQRIRRTTLQAYEHQDVPFEQVVEALQPERSLSRNPLFQVMFALQNAPMSELALSDLQMTLEDVIDESAMFDLLVSLYESGDVISGTLNYAEDLFDRSTIQRWVACFATLLRGLVDGVVDRVADLPLLPEAEREQVIRSFNATAMESGSPKLIHELFEEQVARTPDATAVEHEGDALTYQALNQQANQLARYLMSRGVGPDRPVAVCFERGLDMLVGLLGTLKAGGAYLPLDPNYPAERLQQMVADAAPPVVLTQEVLRSKLPSSAAELIVLDTVRAQLAGQSDTNLTSAQTGLRPDHLLYVIYTSGSTGRPKGTAMPHRAMANLLAWHRRELPAAGKRVLQFAAFSFDVAFQEMFSTLCDGGTLVLLDEWIRRDAHALSDFINDQRIDRLFAPPLMLQSVAESCQAIGQVPGHLKDVITAGEQLRVSAEIRGFFGKLPGCRLHNHYGPTETHVVTALTLSGDPQQWPTLPSIGKPIANTQIYVLDARRQPVPIGVAGELYIGGANVARGYLYRDELTSTRFVRDPFSDRPQARLYKTGDLARWRADGTIEYLGRNDDQVKVRGFRIELGEIEAQLARHEAVKEAAVITHEETPGLRRLVAYVVARDSAAGPSVEELRGHLKSLLPDHMVPSAFVLLEQLPLTPSGKLDRRSLPAPAADAYVRQEYEAPQGEVEASLAKIWQEVLKVERVGRNDNFFGLGGHSLLIVQMMERLRQAGLATSVRSVYQSTTLADLARAIVGEAVQEFTVPPNPIPPDCEHITPQMLPLVQLEAEHIERLVQAVPGGARNVEDIYPLAPLQEGILFHHLLADEHIDTYVVAMLLQLSSRRALDGFVNALQKVVERHGILRSSIHWEHVPKPVQVVHRRAAVPVQEISLDRNIDAIQQLQARMESEPDWLDLRQAPLLRLQVAADPRGESWYVILRLHHIVIDHESLHAVINETIALLREPAVELAVPTSYRNHVAQALAHAPKDDVETFFRAKLGDVVETTAPYGVVDVHGDGSRIVEAQQVLEPTLSMRLRLQARRLGMSVATLFHSGWALVLAKTTTRDDLVFGTVLLGRLQSDAGAQQALGMFINTLPLRLRLAGATAMGLVEQTQRELRELVNHEQASLAIAQRCSGTQGNSPLFTTLLNYRWSSVDVEDEFAAGDVGLLGLNSRTSYPISLHVLDKGEQFNLGIETDRAIDPQRLMTYFCTALESLVDALERAPQTQITALDIVREAEREQVLKSFNATAIEFPPTKLIHRLFEEQVARTAQATAVEHEGRSLSYSELNQRANQLAQFLRARGVGPDRPVAVCFERGLDMVVALLGALKAGGAYLPLDPNYPAERLQQMVEDATPPVVLTQQALASKLPASAAEVIVLDAQRDEIDRERATDLAPASIGLRPDHLLYVIYTSGSTGRPKGTAMPHRSMANLIEWHRQEFPESAGTRVLQFAAFSFDVAFQEIFSTLCTGGTLVLIDEWIRRDARALGEYLNAQRIERLFVPPLMLQSVAESYLSAGETPKYLRDVITAGEQLRISPEIARLFQQLDGCRLHNHYGPTETHVVTTLTLSGDPKDWPTLPAIGKPIANTKLYVLDGQRQPVPLDVAGELYIGGANVARGYLHRHELTAERFIRDPFSDDPQARLYKTGDVARWRADGTLDYLGRNDDQVKIRGFRVELGEIEAQLARHEEAKDVAVVAREESGGPKRLVAYVVARDLAAPPAVEDLRAHMKALLPEHMVPSAFVLLERLPLTPSGKLDRRALPAPEAGAYVSREYEPPRGAVEESLASVWQELLKVERVGRNDNFFELGGHSLLIVQMMERLRKLSLSVNVRTIYQSTTLADLARAIAGETVEEFEVPPNLIPEGCTQITPPMLPLVALEPEHIEHIVSSVPGGAANIQDIYPLAPLQEGMLFHHLLDTHGGDLYLLPILLSFDTREKLEGYQRALQQVIDRHDVLRTAMLWKDLPRAVQVVQRHATLPVDTITLRSDVDALEQMMQRVKLLQQRIDLQRAPMMMLQAAADPKSERWYAILYLHHVVCDHESLDLMLAEVLTHMARPNEVAGWPKPIPYRNHVAQALARTHAEGAEQFFQKNLGSVTESTAPFGILEIDGDGTSIEQIHDAVDPALAERVRVQAKRLSMSPAPLFHAAWGLVLAATTGRDDVVFGSVLLGRMQGRAGAQHVLGMFINTLPLRITIEAKTARQLVETTQRALAELLTHEQASLAEAQRCSGVSGSAPLFTAILNYRHNAVDVPSSFKEVQGVDLLTIEGWTNYPLMLSVDDYGTAFALSIDADRRIDGHRTIAYMHTAVRSLVEALEQASQAPALDLAVMPAAERQAVLRTFNGRQAAYPREKLIHQLFEEQAARTPDAVAVEHAGVSLKYAELNLQANRLARYLRGKGVRADRPVAVCFERGPQMLVGLLGVLKAGGAYLPLDPNYPAERLQQMVEDASPTVVLTQEAVRARVPQSAAEVVALEAAQEVIENEADTNLWASEVGLRSDHLLYVIYTSGSTGRPKGTAMSHRSMVNLIEWHRQEFPKTAGTRVLQFAALSFDVAFQEIFSTLCLGGTLVLIDEWQRRDARELGEYLNSMRIERLFVPPLMLQSVAESYLSEGETPTYLRDVITAGEQLRISPEIIGLFQHVKGCRLHNHYGPTETHVVTALTLSGDPQQWPTLPAIGKPITNTQIYVLDARRQPVPIGVPGEVYIGGANVACGYLHRAALTAERFVRDPFSAEPQARMYKTGDLGRWHADGTIEYLGRNDDQVKIRGFRIELGEVEAQLAAHPEVREVAVVAREDAPGQKRLVAYVVARNSATHPTVETLRAHMKALLPEHMVPSAFVLLEQLPVTPSGKLDRRALPAPEANAYVAREYEAPQGEVEEILVAIWQELLKNERVGRHDNFFELGGHSLLIVQMMERLRKVSLPVNVRTIYQSATLADLARAVVAETMKEFEVPPNLIPEGCTQITPQMLTLVALEPKHIDYIVGTVPGGAANVQDIYPLAPLQGGMLFHHLMDEHGGDTYLVPILLSFDTRDKLDGYLRALHEVMDRHDMLRTAVLWNHLPRPVQVVYRSATLPVDTITLSRGSDALEQMRRRAKLRQKRLDLQRAPMMMLEAAADPNSEQWYAILYLHHIVADHQALDLMLMEVIDHMARPAEIWPKAAPFRNHVAQVMTYTHTETQRYFQKKLGDVTESTAPFGVLEVEPEAAPIERLEASIELSLAERLRVQARRLAVSPAALFHGAWALVVAATTGRDDVVFGTVLLGRMHSRAGAQRILGLFMNTLPLRITIGGKTAKQLVETAQRELAGMLRHEQASLAQVQRCSGLSGSAPLFTAIFNYRHSEVNIATFHQQVPGVEILRIESWTNYPLSCSVDDFGNEFGLSVDADRRIDAHRIVDCMNTALRSLIEALESEPQKTLALDLAVMPARTDAQQEESRALIG